MPAAPDDRSAVRRRALLDAGIGLLGAGEPGALTVRAVCRSTGVTERYFYGIFGNRDDFVRAVYDDVSAQATAALVAASAGGGELRELAERAVDAFVRLMIDDPMRGRVLLLAAYREPVLAVVGLDHMQEFFAIVAAAMPDRIDDEVRTMTSVHLVGAMTALFTQFLGGSLEVSRDALVRHCVDLIATTAERSAAG